MANFDLYSLFYSLEDYGVFEFILPFLLVFAISFAILEKAKIFGEDEKGKPRTNINMILSLIIGLLIVTQFEIIQTINNFLPKVSLFLVVAVMFLVLVSLFGAKVEHGFSGIILGIVTIIVLYILYWSLGPSLGFEVPYWIEDYWGWILVIIIFLIFLFYLKGGAGKDKSFGDRVSGTLSTGDKFFDKLLKEREREKV